MSLERTYPILVGHESFFGRPERASARTFKVIQFRAPITKQQVVSALELMVDRHDALRVATQITPEGPRLVFHDVIPQSTWLVDDLEAANTSDEEWLKAVAQAPVDSGQNVFRAHMRTDGKDVGLVIMTFLHVGFDGVSTQIVVNDLLTAIARIADSSQPDPSEVRPSYEAYVQSHSKDPSELSQAQLAYWQGLLGGGSVTSLAEIAIDPDAPLLPPSSYMPVWSLSAGELAELESKAKDEGVTVPSIILALASGAASRATGGGDIIISSVLSWRPQGFEGTPGLFGFRRVYIRIETLESTTLLQAAQSALHQFTKGVLFSRTAFNATRIRQALQGSVHFPPVGELLVDIVPQELQPRDASPYVRILDVDAGSALTAPLIAPLSLSGIVMLHGKLGADGISLELLVNPTDPAFNSYRRFGALLKDSCMALTDHGLSSRLVERNSAN